MSHGLWVLLTVFTLAAVLGAPLGLSMLAAGFAYLISTHQDVGLVVDQTMNGLYNSYLLIAVPLFIFVANVMNASGVIERLLAFGAAMVGHLPGGLAQVNVESNLIFSGMSGSAVADASGPGLIVARMMTKNDRYPRGFAAATSVVSATLGPLMPTSIPMIFYALIANASVGAMFLGGLVPAGLMALSMMIVIAIIARRRGFPREARTSWRETPAILGRTLLPVALPGILLGLIYSGITDADRGGRDRGKLRTAAGVRGLPLIATVGTADGDFRHGAGHRDDRADHVRRLRVQLRGGERGRAAFDPRHVTRLEPVGDGLSAVRRRADAAAGDRA